MRDATEVCCYSVSVTFKTVAALFAIEIGGESFLPPRSGLWDVREFLVKAFTKIFAVSLFSN